MRALLIVIVMLLGACGDLMPGMGFGHEFCIPEDAVPPVKQAKSPRGKQPTEDASVTTATEEASSGHIAMETPGGDGIVIQNEINITLCEWRPS